MSDSFQDGGSIGSLWRYPVKSVMGEELHAAIGAGSEEYWPDMDGLEYRDTVTDFPLPAGTFFDCAYVRLLTTRHAAPARWAPFRGPLRHDDPAAAGPAEESGHPAGRRGAQ